MTKTAVAPNQYTPQIPRKLKGVYMEQKSDINHVDEIHYKSKLVPAPNVYNNSIDVCTKYPRQRAANLNRDTTVRTKTQPRTDLSPHSHKTEHYVDMMRSRSPKYSFSKTKDNFIDRTVAKKKFVPGAGAYKTEIS